MDKQKQIEEMATIIEHACDDCDDLNDCLNCPHKSHEYYGCGKEKTATKLYKAGYRKIPEGSVVLTKFEYDEMLADVTASKKKLARIIDSAKSKGQKEMAKEILKNLLKEFSVRKSCGNADVVVLELAKRYGVEVEE